MTDTAQTVVILTDETTGLHYWFAEGAEGGPFGTIAEAKADAQFELLAEVSEEAELPHILRSRS